LWAAIERPHGRFVDFLLDHGVIVYPINPKSLDRARDRFRVGASNSDPFDAKVLALFLRSDHAHLRPLLPSSDAAQELKGLTRDSRRQGQAEAPLPKSAEAHFEGVLPARARAVWRSHRRLGPGLPGYLSDARRGRGAHRVAVASVRAPASAVHQPHCRAVAD